MNIGNMMPARRWHYWRFASDHLSADVPRRITASIRMYALPWFEDFQSLDDVLRATRHEAFASRAPMISSFGLPDDDSGAPTLS